MAFPRRDEERQFVEEFDEDDPEGRSKQHEKEMGAGKPPVSIRHEESPVSLVPPEEAAEFRETWNDIQSRFVDEPRSAVEEADQLVADVMKRVTDLFLNERSGLERQWSRGDNISTEDLRIAMQRYRSFFDRLLSR